jgi:hypothetical protein
MEIYEIILQLKYTILPRPRKHKVDLGGQEKLGQGDGLRQGGRGLKSGVISVKSRHCQGDGAAEIYNAILTNFLL